MIKLVSQKSSVLTTSRSLFSLAAVAKAPSGRLYLKDFDTFSIVGIREVDNRKKLEEVNKIYVPAWKAYKKDMANWETSPPAERGEEPQPPLHPLENHLIYFDYKTKDLIYCEKVWDPKLMEDYVHLDPKEYSMDDIGRVVKVTTDIERSTPLTEKDIVSVLEYRVSMTDNSPVHETNWKNERAQIPLYRIMTEAGLTRDEELALEKLERTFANVEHVLSTHQQWGIPLYMYGVNELFRKFIDGLVKVIAERQKGESDKRMGFEEVYSTDLTRYLIAQDFAAEYKSLATKIKSEMDALQNLKPEDAPKIPHVNPKFKLMPHQAIALAMLDRVDTGLAAVATGGGKTGIIGLDILNQISKGRVKRALVVMPTQSGLVAQQKKQLERVVTDGMINIIGITSQSFARMGASAKKRFDALEKLINSSPPNTIILTTYEWIKITTDDNLLRKRLGFDKAGTEHKFERPFWLMNACHVDYVALDESHKIRNVSKASEAAMAFASVPIRRIATGTIIENNPEDLHRQVSFLDPLIFGSRDQFLSNYAAEIKTDARKGRSKAVSWRDEAPQELKQKLRENGAILIDRSHWLHMLPKLVGPVVHKAEMSPAQRAIYQEIFEDTINELERLANETKLDEKGEKVWKDKSLHDAWVKFQASSTGDDEELEENSKGFQFILKKLSFIDSFLNSPVHMPPHIDDKTGEQVMYPPWKVDDSSRPGKKIRVDKILSGSDLTSPKCRVIDEILDKHFADPANGKVLILSQNKNSVMHIATNIKRRAQADYYMSGRKSALEEFQDPNSKVKILVATDKSVEVGLNLHYVCNRIIRCGIVWNPGSMDQGFARAWRPGSDKPGRITQFDNLYIDFVLCEHSVDFTKYARFVWKENYARQINSSFSTQTHIPPIAMNMSFITSFNTSDLAQPYHDHYMTMFEHEKVANQSHRHEYGDRLHDVRSGGGIKGEKKIVTPTMPEEGNDDDETTTLIIEVKKTSKGMWMEVKLADLEIDDDILRKLKWKLDKPRKVWFFIASDDSRFKRMVSDLEKEDIIVHVNNPHVTEEEIQTEAEETGKDVEQVREEKTEEVERSESEDLHQIKLEIYDSTEENQSRKLYLRIPKTSDNVPILKKYGFKYHLKWYYYFFKSKSDAIRVLDRIHAKNIKIRNPEVAEEIKTYRFVYSKIKPGPGKVELISRVPKSKAKGEVTVYLDWRNQKPCLTVSEKESTADLVALRTLGFKDVDPPAYWRRFTSNSELLVLLKKLRSDDVRVKNWSDFLAGARKWKFKIPPTMDLSVEQVKNRAER